MGFVSEWWVDGAMRIRSRIGTHGLTEVLDVKGKLGFSLSNDLFGVGSSEVNENCH